MSIKKKLDAAAVGLVAVGSGSPRSAQKFVDDFHFTGDMYLNRNLNVYKAFDLERGIIKTLGPSSLIQGFRAMKKGFRQGQSAGDLWQQGGLFVLGPGDQVLFAHRDRFAGDHTDLQQMLPKIWVWAQETDFDKTL